MIRRTLSLAAGLGALALLAACSNPVSPVEHAGVALHASVSGSGSQKCDGAPAASEGALNMLNDPTMGSTPMVHDAPQGNTGMFTAVGASGC